MEEFVVCTEARLTPPGELIEPFPQAAGDIFEQLRPGKPKPASPGQLAKALTSAPAKINEWCRSSARGGADLALRFVLSWYDGVDLDQLDAMRAGVDLEPLRDAILYRASTIATYVAVDEFVPDTSEGAGVEEEDEGAAGTGDDDAGGAGDQGVGGGDDPDATGAGDAGGAGDDAVRAGDSGLAGAGGDDGEGPSEPVVM